MASFSLRYGSKNLGIELVFLGALNFGLKDKFMEIASLTVFLSPFLPTLLRLGGKAVDKATESAASKLGDAAFAKAQAIWGKLSPKVEAKEAAKEAAIDVANNPEDEDSLAALRVQLKKLLEQDEELMKAIATILEEDPLNGNAGTTIMQNATGHGNQTIGQMNGGTATMADRRTVFVAQPSTTSTKDDLMGLSPEETARRVAAFERFVENKRRLWDSLTPEEQAESDEQFEELYKSLAESRR